MKPAILVLILASGIIAVNSLPERVYATHDPKNFVIVAQFAGWNSTLPAGTLTACSDPGTPTCDPAVTEFRQVSFTITVKWKDFSHNFAIYTRSTTPDGVSSAHTCNPPGTGGCWAKSTTVSSSAPTATLSFAPRVPADDLTGPGGYEYYCQFHPNTMHGKITVYKSPNLDNVGLVSIVDAATLAFAYDSTPATPSSWNIAADLDNSGKVDILDASLLAFYYDRQI